MLCAAAVSSRRHAATGWIYCGSVRLLLQLGRIPRCALRSARHEAYGRVFHLHVTGRMGCRAHARTAPISPQRHAYNGRPRTDPSGVGGGWWGPTADGTAERPAAAAAGRCGTLVSPHGPACPYLQSEPNFSCLDQFKYTIDAVISQRTCAQGLYDLIISYL